MRSAFRVIRTVREKHACRRCDRIVQATAPSRPIKRGITGPGLLARVLEDIPVLAANALKDACGLTNPIQATQEEIEAIFRSAM